MSHGSTAALQALANSSQHKDKQQILNAINSAIRTKADTTDHHKELSKNVNARIAYELRNAPLKIEPHINS